MRKDREVLGVESLQRPHRNLGKYQGLSRRRSAEAYPQESEKFDPLLRKSDDYDARGYLSRHAEKLDTLLG